MSSSWQIKRLDELYEIARGGSPRPIKNYMTAEANGINWIKISDATASTKYIYETKEKIKPEGVKMSRLVYEGDFILSNSMSFGRPYIMKTTGCIHDGWLVFHAKTNQIDNDYMYYLLGSDVVYQQFDRLAAGSTVRNLNSDLVRGVTIPVPPLPEQQRIVAVLDETFAGIATATENVKKNLQNSRELFEGHLQSIFTNKGDGWVEKMLGGICQNLDSKRVPITKKDRDQGQYPYYGASGIVDYVGNFIFDDDLLLVSEDGANLLARTYPIAFSVSGKVWVNNHAHVLKFDKPETQRFVEYYLNSIKLDDYVSGMAQPKLNQKSLNSIPVPIPPLSEQQRIVAQLDTLATETGRLEAIYRQKLDNLAALKQSILQKAFAGELTITKTTVQIIPFPQKVNTIGTAELHAGIIATAYQNHKNSPQHVQNFGYVKAEKIVHLAEAWVGVDLERRPLQMSYGPADIAACEAAQAWAKTNNCFTFDKRDTPYKLVAGKNIENLIEKTRTALGTELGDKLNKLIHLTLHMGKIETEVLATLFAAWNNRLLNSQSVTDAEIILDARDNWHPDKLAIKRSEFSTMLKWMKQNNFVPEGRGKLVKKGALI